MDNRKKYILTMSIVMMIVILAGTFAWLTYRSRKTAMVLTIGDLSGVQVTLTPYQFKGTLTPTLLLPIYTETATGTSVSDTEAYPYTTVTVTNHGTKTGRYRLYYQFDIDRTDSAFIQQSDKLKYTVLKLNNDTGEYEEYASGDFDGLDVDSYIWEIEYNTIAVGETYNYKVYFWLYGEENNNTLVNKTIVTELRADILYEANKPVLDDGMIPVTIADNGTVTTVSENDSSWYNYCGLEEFDNGGFYCVTSNVWANAVLVKESGVKTRAQNSVVGTVINPSDILAYFVWIPRYSYKIWTTGVSNTGSEQEIDIRFIDTDTKHVGTTVGSYYTPPAFTFDGNELDGIWVGKFETSTDTSSTCYTNSGSTNCNNTNQSPRILPNVASLRYQTVSNQFQTAIKFAGGTMTDDVVSFNSTNDYGVTTSDAHMMKNSEWGAVAYLSHSRYGINTEIRINNNSSYTTGCGASAANGASTTECQITYGNASLYPQSTTGNISGIFDMSGGAYEYVMGNYANTIGFSGLTAAWFTNNSKYYDLYPSSVFTGDYSTNMTFCTLATCGGHALNETKAWYGDTAYFVSSNNPWFDRGGLYSHTSHAGAFYSNSTFGGNIYHSSFRSVIIPGIYASKANKPVLDNGMIPVTIANNGTVTTVSENDSSWYDYDNQKWANAVLVKASGVKTRAQNKVAGTVIDSSDILAYFVWIPRYSYKVWQYTGVSATGNEQKIEIKFVNTNTKEMATGNGEWYTHPAFTFGGEELDGIWVGKFETSADTSSTCYTSASSSNCNNTNQSPRIVPNVSSLRYQTVSNQFQTAIKFAGGTMTDNVVSFNSTNTYGVTTSDAHMMKNSEWGAVAYLSHSRYGINTEIRINNNSNFTTGCGASAANGTRTTDCQIIYGNASLYPQSTTGNISGVFDMSGGAYEYVMGNYANTIKSSNLTAEWFTNNSKYYDLYPSDVFTGNSFTNITFCTLATCGGHALNETKNWYNDYFSFVDSGYPWFIRGGSYNNTSGAGAFYSNGNFGSANINHSFRVSLVAR